MLPKRRSTLSVATEGRDRDRPARWPVAMVHRSSHDKETQQDRQFSSLLEIGKTLSSALPLKISIHQVLSILMRRHGALRSAVMLRGDGGQKVHIEASIGLRKSSSGFHHPNGAAIASRVLETGRPVLIPDVNREIKLAGGGPRRFTAEEVTFLCAPVLVNYTPVGCLSVELRSKKGRHYAAEAQFFHVVASMMAQAVKTSRASESDRRQLSAENAQLREDLRQRYAFSNLVGNSGAIRSVYQRMTQAASTNAAVLLRGEPGTGKELIARMIHSNSSRKNGPFIKMHCAEFPPSRLGPAGPACHTRVAGPSAPLVAGPSPTVERVDSRLR